MLRKARVKKQENFPPLELCCVEAIKIQKQFFGLEIEIDTDDTSW